ncbi:substrate-binding domain-containing protein [Planctomycetes bacterium K23_9]|uniref:Binding protein n=1 Tax=Stieleria marina TaxID=1930275 RepID=A0A517NMY1_9BACT|nr:Putative binding protein precursor [Planctomycetes bacterium K23_9]
MNKFIALIVGSSLLLAAMIFLLVRNDQSTSITNANGEAAEPLVLFCAASNRAVMEAIRSDYEAEFNRPLQIQYGPSQTLLSSIEVSKTGDLFLPADDSYLAMASDKELVAEIIPVAKMQAVVAVRKGNPKSITQFDDLLSKDARFIQANPDAAAVGKLTRNVLSKVGLWKKLDDATTATHTTVTDVARDIDVGAADAGIVFDAVLHTFDGVDFVELPELADAQANISVGVIASSKQPQAALHFARYAAAIDRGMKRYEEFGFRVDGKESWGDIPELNIFAGSMLRPAIEDTIAAFESREGIRVNRVYNGCGILVGQMKAGQHPDAYFACDSEFMDQVTDLFPERVDVSENELVILVQKGNPNNITTLKDLTRKGLRVGVGHEKQCAMGWLTQKTFREGGIQTKVMDNVTVQSPTGDMLVNQLQAGSLDAAVAYLSNAAGAAEFLDAYPITGISCSTATQPWAVATDSKYPETASRLFQKICSAKSQDDFAAEGFRWKLQTVNTTKTLPGKDPETEE